MIMSSRIAKDAYLAMASSKLDAGIYVVADFNNLSFPILGHGFLGVCKVGHLDGIFEVRLDRFKTENTTVFGFGAMRINCCSAILT